MSDDGEILVELLREVLGDEHLHYESKGQISFDCPECDDGVHFAIWQWLESCHQNTEVRQGRAQAQIHCIWQVLPE